MDLHRQLDRGPEHVEEPSVLAPPHRGFPGQGARNRTRLATVDGQEHELLAGTSGGHLFPIARDRASVPEEHEPLSQGSAAASVEILDEYALPLAGRAAPDENRLAVRMEVGPPGVDIAERDRSGLARPSRQEHELRRGTPNEGENPLPVRRERL